MGIKDRAKKIIIITERRAPTGRIREERKEERKKRKKKEEKRKMYGFCMDFYGFLWISLDTYMNFYEFV